MNPERRRFSLLAGAVLSLAACSRLLPEPVPPKIGIADIEVKSLGLFEQTFDVGLRVDNRNDFELAIEALEFEIEANGRPFASGHSQHPVRIPAASDAVLRVEATTQSETLLRQLKRLPRGGLKAGVPYRIRGRVKIEGLPGWLPFDRSGTVGGEAKPPKGEAV